MRAFLGFGANAGDPSACLAATLRELHARGIEPAACARPVWSAFLAPEGSSRDDVPPVLNTVVEVRAALTPRTLLDALLDIERAAGRVRDGRPERALDLDVLAIDDLVVGEPGLTVPHPRALERAFVIAPWAEIAPGYVVPGTGAPVIAHAASLQARVPAAFRALEPAPLPELPRLDSACVVLEDRTALASWRDAQDGRVGVVPTMGALHDGHLSLMRRAHATCDAVLGTLFVNPLQFGPDEDLARYPRTLDRDVAAMQTVGVDAVYVPAPDDLYPADFSTFVEPAGPALGYEGATRAGHFRGVATIVTKLLQRTRPDHAFFGQKDAQQVAVVRRLVRDLDLPGFVVVGETVRDRDGLALSSRNRFLGEGARARALALPRALAAVASSAAHGERDRDGLVAAGIAVFERAGGQVDYLDVVDPESFSPVEDLVGPALAVAAIRVDDVHLIDNVWVSSPA